MQNSSNLVSVIVPVYNTEKYLKKCLNSILNQSYRNLEIIIVNDGSTDSSGIICKEIQEYDDRVIYYEQNNKGLSSARNVGVNIAKGDFLAFVDSDDIIAPCFIGEMLSLMMQYNCDIACCESILFFEDDEEKAKRHWKDITLDDKDVEILESDKAIINSLYDKIRVTEIPYKIYKKETFKGVEFPEMVIYEDLATTYRLFLNADNVAVIHQKLYGYRLRKDSIFKGRYSRKNLSSVWVSESISESIGNVLKYNNAASCACFRVNRISYSKVPFTFREDRKQIWFQIRKHRKCVLFDRDARTHERILAGCSYGGELFFKLVVYLFDCLKYTYYYLQR